MLIRSRRYYANWCQLVLAVVEIFVSKVKADRARKARDEAKGTAEGREGEAAEKQRKSTMATRPHATSAPARL